MFVRLLQPKLHIGGRTVSSYDLLRLSGLVLALLLGTVLSRAADLDLAVTGLVALVALVAVLLTGQLSYILTGSQQMIFYRYQVVIIAAVALVLALLRQPILAYLDILVIAIAAAQMLGRLGCTVAGCCHGRPWDWGIRYPERYSVTRLPRYLLGVQLFPVQLTEAACLAALVSVGSIAVVGGAAAGTALSVVLVGYALCRFVLEYLRGDVAGTYHGHFSEAQWTAFATVFVVALLGGVGLLPSYIWQWGAVALLLALLLWRRPSPLLQPRHLREVAYWLGRLDATVQMTEQGLHLSLNRDGAAHIYTISRSAPPLTLREAEQLAQLITRVQHPQQRYTLLDRQPIFHILIEPAP